MLRIPSTTDHKLIGIMYLVTAFGFFMAGGAMAILMRTELAAPGMQFLSYEQYNQLVSPRTAPSCCCSTPRPYCSGSPTRRCRCRSAPDVAFPRLKGSSF